MMAGDVGKLILRLALGILVLLHGIAKIRTGVDSIVTGLEGIGMPSWFAFGVYLGEIAAPIMVIIGLFARTGAFIIFVNMIFAIVLVHRNELFLLGKQGGWALELQGMYLFTALALVLMSPGRYSVTRRF
jgi:putative oxidoreductase